MFDLASLGTKEDLTKGAWLEFENEAGDPMFRIKLTSTDGDVGEQLIYERVDKSAKKGRISQPTARHAVEQNIRLLAKLTLAWQSLDEKNGKWIDMARCGDEELTFSFDHAVWLYSNIPAIYDRVNQFVSNPENFVPRGPISAEERAASALNGHIEAIEGNSDSGLSGDSATKA